MCTCHIMQTICSSNPATCRLRLSSLHFFAGSLASTCSMQTSWQRSGSAAPNMPGLLYRFDSASSFGYAGAAPANEFEASDRRCQFDAMTSCEVASEYGSVPSQPYSAPSRLPSCTTESGCRYNTLEEKRVAVLLHLHTVRKKYSRAARRAACPPRRS